MRLLVFLLVLTVMVDFNGLQCQEVITSQLTDLDTPLKPGAEVRSDNGTSHAKTSKQQGRCVCNGVKKLTAQCPPKSQCILNSSRPRVKGEKSLGKKKGPPAAEKRKKTTKKIQKSVISVPI